jgi:type II restriction/modification system DNA methylase subunit YeeA
MNITPQEFVSKWKRVNAREKQIYQEHFIDLCHLIGHPTPLEYDPDGKTFAFEMGATKTAGGQGWADVAKLGYFGLEYKGKNDDMEKAYAQLLQYRDSLQNPPLLIVSDINRIIIRTNYTNYKTQKYTFELDDLLKAENLRVLKAVFFNPDELKPHETLKAVTEKAAKEFAELATTLRKYGEDSQKSAHFLIRILFCLFAQDVGLLPQGLLSRIVEQTRNNSRDLSETLKELFAKMSKGGFFGVDKIPYINGGLFDDDSVVQLDSDGMSTLQRLDKLDWAFIEPSIFGTLFERGLDPTKRSQLGAHYTGIDDILLIVEPVLMSPLRREWAELKAAMQAIADERDMIRKGESETINAAIRAELQKFSDKIASIRVLDPACGSGNFLYVALRLLLDLQKEVSIFCESLKAGRLEITVSPMQLHGIEINEYARELAQLTIWIGYIQWLVENGYGLPEEPILKSMQNIVRMDAILATPSVLAPSVLSDTSPKFDGTSVEFGGGRVGVEPAWHAADVIVGNPPFLGGNKIRAELGDEYVDALFKLYEGRVPAFSDLVCYWFEKARAMIEEGKIKRVGLLATQGIRGGVNRKVLEKIKETGDIFWAFSDRDWILNGATVHVSMIGFDNKTEKVKFLDDNFVDEINPDLTTSVNATQAEILQENTNISFQGPSPKGKFDVEEKIAKDFLKASNVNSRPNSDVVRPVVSAIDIGQANRNMWTIDFGLMPIEDAAMYEKPFEYVKKYVYPVRAKNRRAAYAEKWWQYAEARPGMRTALEGLSRYIATPRVSKYRIFVWLDMKVLANDGTIVFSRSDDYFFGILHSKTHELWARRTGTQLREAESGFRYTPTSTFETFPFPFPPAKEPKKDPRVKAIAQAAKELVEQRDRWVNPTPSVLSDTSPKSKNNLEEEGRGQKRTLTNLYNQRPTWLDLAHKKLDEAVFAAYGWESNLSDEEILESLLKLNLERSKE